MAVENLVGQSLGQYELRELLGAVYKGYQASLKRYVAVKVLAAHLVNQAGALERFNREAETSAALEHPNIIPIHDYGTQRGVSYLVMKLLTGGSLAERLEQHQDRLPSLGEIAALLKALSSALDYAHSQGVIHRDIKPSNVMFDNHGTPYLVDFGIAKLSQATSGLTASVMVVGTWGYMAPEQWRAETLSGASDQYALAVMTYALITGRMPFDAPTPAGIMHKHLVELPTPPHTVRPTVPEAVTLVLERALAKDAGERFPTCTAFAQSFDGAIRGHTGPTTQFFTAPVQKRPVLPVAASSSQPSRAFVEPSSTSTQPFYRSRAAWAMLAVMGIMAVVIVALLSGLVGGGNDEETTPVPTDAAAAPTLTPSQAALVMIPSGDEPTETPPPSATVQPTDTALPTATETPPPSPTSTPTATPDPLQAALDAARHFEGGNANWQPFVQPFDGVEMVLVPAGCFEMGSNKGDFDEQPVHTVCFEEPFWLDHYEVSQGQFAQFGGQAASDPYFTGDDLPVEQITWFEARDYCESREARLPTEAEWEYAARGRDGLVYPWGNTFDCRLGNFDDETTRDQFVIEGRAGCDGYDGTAPVGSFPAGASWVGALDISGNVWEWVADWYGPYSSAAQTAPKGPTSGEYRVLRGGSWNSEYAHHLRGAIRNRFDPDFWYYDVVGFRCARSAFG